MDGVLDFSSCFVSHLGYVHSAAANRETREAKKTNIALASQLDSTQAQ